MAIAPSAMTAADIDSAGGDPTARLAITERSAASFGILPNVNSTVGFAAMSAWLKGAGAYERRVVRFPGGLFYSDYINIPVPDNPLAGGVSLLAAGQGLTLFAARVSSQPVFMDINGSQTKSLEISGIFLTGTGVTNVGQAPYAILPTYINGAGDITHFKIDIRTYGFDAPAFGRGSQLSTGEIANKCPLQQGDFINCFHENRDHATGRPELIMLGQIGQVNFMNGSADGNGRLTDLGPAVVISKDYRIQQIQAASENTTNATWTANADLVMPSMTAVRVLGTGMPTTSPQIAKGTTYYLHKPSMSLLSGANNQDFQLATSRANAAAGSFITISVTGTPASYSFAQLWAISLINGEFTTEENHMFIDYDRVTPVGTNLPSGLSVSTSYVVKRTGHRTFRLAVDLASAVANVFIDAAGGTLSDFGFCTHTGLIANYSDLSPPYSINFMGAFTVQSKETGLFLGGVQGCTVMGLHAEETKRNIEAIGGTKLTLLPGENNNRAGYSEDGTGALVVSSGSGTEVIAIGSFPITTANGILFVSHQATGSKISLELASYNGPNVSSTLTDKSSGLTRNVSNSGNNLDIGIEHAIAVNPSGQQTLGILDRMLAGAMAVLWPRQATPFYVEYGTGRNIECGGADRVRFASFVGAIFSKRDAGGGAVGAGWKLLSLGNWGIYVYQSNPYAASYTPDHGRGNVELAPLTGNITINQEGGVAPILGQRWSIALAQDGTGGRTVSWNAAYKGITLAASGTANQKAFVEFRWDSVAWVQVSVSPWYS